MKTARRRFESLSPSQVFLKPRPSTRPRESATPGFTAISPQGWRYCHSLRIVKLPDTVVTLDTQYSKDVTPYGNIVDGGCHLAIGAIISQ